jgi:acyl-CoA thioester hydrolase
LTRMKNVSAKAEFEVAFYDLDPMDIVWHGNYAKYLELGRGALLEKIEYSYSQMRASGYSWPVIELKVRYIKPAKLGQKLICIATVVDFENRLKIAYEIRCAESGERLTKAHSVQVAVDMAKEEMQLVSPKILHDKMKVALDSL